jgi:thiol-disulfide isomerase/thioredoxin
MSTPLRAALVIVLIAAAGALGFGAYRWLAADPPAASVARADPSAAATPDQVASSGNAAPVPKRTLAATRPVFALQDREGKLRSIKEWDGKSLVINFWATWCAPCRREIPMLRELHRARAGENVEVIGIAVDFREPVLAYAAKMQIDYPILIGEQDGLEAAEAFGIGMIGLPFTVFTDNQGRVVTAHLGELHGPEADLILDAVSAINKGEVSLEQGQERIAAGLKEAGRKSSQPG